MLRRRRCLLHVQKRRRGFCLRKKKKPALRVGGPLWGKRMRSHKLEARILQKSPVWPFAMAYPGPDLSCLLRGLQREMSSHQGPRD